MASRTLTSPPSGLHHGTLAALRFPNFRLYFIGQVISLSGTWMQAVAQGWLVFHLTQSELWLGIVACAAGLPTLVLAPFAGVLVDRFPRRTLLLIAQFGQMILALILAALTFANTVQVWHIVVLAFLLGIMNAIDAPCRHAIVADLVDRESMNSGIALNSIMFNGSRVLGPAAAGIALAQVGPAWCFLFNGLSFLAVIFMLLIMKVNSVIHSTSTASPMNRLKEGLRFSRNHPTILPLLLMAVCGSLFTGNLSTLLPAFSDVILHSPEEAYAILSVAIGIGAVAAGLVLAPVGKRFGRGRVLMFMTPFVLLTALFFSFSSSTTMSAFWVTLFGFGIILQFTTVNTLIQNEVPDEFRGRVMSLYSLTWFGIAPFGSLALSAVAQQFGSPIAITIFEILGAAAMVILLYRWPRSRALI